MHNQNQSQNERSRQTVLRYEVKLFTKTLVTTNKRKAIHHVYLRPVVICSLRDSSYVSPLCYEPCVYAVDFNSKWAYQCPQNFRVVSCYQKERNHTPGISEHILTDRLQAFGAPSHVIINVIQWQVSLICMQSYWLSRPK